MLTKNDPPKDNSSLQVVALDQSTNTQELASDILSSVSFSGSPASLENLTINLAQELQADVRLHKYESEPFSSNLEKAREFISQRYDNLNLQIPSQVVLRAVSTSEDPNQNSGSAEAKTRSFWLETGTNLHHLFSEGVIVHELTHAIGHVAIQPRANSEEPSLASSGWKLWKKETGAFGPDLPRRMFQMFEEAVAYHNERLYLFANGCTPNLIDTTVAMAPTFERHMIEIAAIYKEITDLQQEGLLNKVKVYHQIIDPIDGSADRETEEPHEQGLHNKIQLISDVSDFIFEIVISGFNTRLMFEKIVAEDGRGTRSVYGAIPPALSLLAKEIYPNDPSPYESLMDELTTAQLTGDRKSILSKFKDTFGPDSIKFFALLDIHDEPGITRFHTTLLSLYAQAGSLGKERASEIRQTLTRILFEARGPRLGWTARTRESE